MAGEGVRLAILLLGRSMLHLTGLERVRTLFEHVAVRVRSDVGFDSHDVHAVFDKVLLLQLVVVLVVLGFGCARVRSQ